MDIRSCHEQKGNAFFKPKALPMTLKKESFSLKNTPLEKPSCVQVRSISWLFMFLIFHVEEMICFHDVQELFITLTS